MKLFGKRANEDQDPFILPQDDNPQGDMLDPATGKPMAPAPAAPRPQEMSEQGQAGRGVQGSKQAAGGQSPEDVTRAEYPLWYIIADALGGTVEPFDVYQGPYIVVPGNEGRLFIVTEDGVSAQVWNEETNEISDEFWVEDENTAVDAAISILSNPPANTLPYGTEREEREEKGPDTSDISDKIPADWKPKEEEEWIPEMSEEDKIRLRGLAPIKGAKNALLKRAIPISTQRGEEICYRCKQPIQEGQPISWEGGMVAHAGACPPTQAQGQGQSRIMFPKGYQPRALQQPAAMAQHASEKVATRRKVTSSYVPTMSLTIPEESAHQVASTNPTGAKWQDRLTIPEESAHQVARVLADAGMRDFDVATDGTEHKSYFSFPSEAESEVAADLIYEAFAPQIAADKGGWASWKERWERPANVPPPQVPIAKMNSKRAAPVPMICSYCGEEIPAGNEAQVDHLKRKHPDKKFPMMWRKDAAAKPKNYEQ